MILNQKETLKWRTSVFVWTSFETITKEAKKSPHVEHHKPKAEKSAIMK